MKWLTLNGDDGYPVPSDCHPERPWWRCGTVGSVPGWRRADGAEMMTVCTARRDFSARYPPEGSRVPQTAEEVDADAASTDKALADYDKAHPLPPPPPLCGQVWKVPEEPAFSIVCEEGPLTVRWGYEASTWGPRVEVVEEWPPAGAVLVSGPLSPWADTSEEAP